MEIKWYSSFKCASDYRETEFTQDLYFKESQFEARIISFLGKIIICLCVCVCVHLDGSNAENTFHCWLYSV